MPQGTRLVMRCRSTASRLLFNGSEVAATTTGPGEFVVIWNDVDITLPYDRTLLVGRPIAVNGTFGDVFLVSPTTDPAEQLSRRWCPSTADDSW